MEPSDNTETVTGFDKLLDRIPYASGAWRRRLISGVIFCGEILLFTVFVLPSSFWERAAIGRTLASRIDSSILRNGPFLILLVLLVYALGALVDVISDGFVVRGVSEMPGIISRLPLPLKIAIGLVWPLLLLAAVVKSSFARTTYELDLGKRKANAPTPTKDDSFREALSEDALRFYENRLHGNVRIGLNEPFGGKAEAAWQALIYLTPDPHKSWTASLDSRNHETSSFLSAALFGTSACVFLYVFGSSRHFLGFALLYGLLWLISYLFLGYLHIVRRSIASMLEFLAFADRASPIGEPSLLIKPAGASEASDT
jgi:hypothetical protein